MTYRIVFLPSASTALAALPREARRRLARRIDGLATEPRPAGVKVLQGGEGLLRLRVGDYRVIYRVEEARVLVLVVRIGHRREIYRRLRG